MDGWYVDKCEGITESEELKTASARQERMGRPGPDLVCSAIGNTEIYQTPPLDTILSQFHPILSLQPTFVRRILVLPSLKQI
jgi:hypothetical protein